MPNADLGFLLQELFAAHAVCNAGQGKGVITTFSQLVGRDLVYWLLDVRDLERLALVASDEFILERERAFAA